MVVGLLIGHGRRRDRQHRAGARAGRRRTRCAHHVNVEIDFYAIIFTEWRGTISVCQGSVVAVV